MKKLMMLLVAFGLVFGASFAMAKNDKGPNASQFCDMYGDFGFSHGECVRTFNACLKEQSSSAEKCIKMLDKLP